MEMIDVLTKLKEIAESKPELVKDAVDNVEKQEAVSALGAPAGEPSSAAVENAGGDGADGPEAKRLKTDDA